MNTRHPAVLAGLLYKQAEDQPSSGDSKKESFLKVPTRGSDRVTNFGKTRSDMLREWLDQRPTYRQLLERYWGGKTKFEDRLERVRTYRKESGKDTFLQRVNPLRMPAWPSSVSDRVLNRKLRPVWDATLWDDGYVTPWGGSVLKQIHLNPHNVGVKGFWLTGGELGIPGHLDTAAHEAMHTTQPLIRHRFHRELLERLIGRRVEKDGFSYYMDPFEMEPRARAWTNFLESNVLDPKTGKLFRINSPADALRGIQLLFSDTDFSWRFGHRMDPSGVLDMGRYKRLFRQDPKFFSDFLNMMPGVVGNGQQQLDRVQSLA